MSLRATVQRQARRALGASRIIAGQPTPETHPELLRDGEVQPGITAAEFAARRTALAAQLPEGGLALVQANPQVFMSGVVPYPFRQNADFAYLTGVNQWGPLAAIGSDGRFTLFFPDADPWREAWDGARLGADAALDFFGADDAAPLSEAPDRLAAMLGAASAVAMDLDRPDIGPLANAVAQLPALKAAAGRGAVLPLRPLVHRLRWIKSPAELSLMRKSAAAAAAAMTDCMARSAPGVSEHSIAAHFEYRCRLAGAQRMAYPPVVAGGANACTIHYSRNDVKLTGKEALLLDGGCELYGYCSDVTRTWPMGGRFSGAQAAVYDAVLEAHRRLLAAVRPGATLRALHSASIRLLAEALAGLGVPALGTSAEALMSSQAFREFYPHSVGHWLGMDVHDVSTVSHDRPLEPGVVLTIEPGLYIPDREEFGPLAGIGVRLEDDVAVMAEGAEVLSAAAPLERSDVEAVVGSAPPLIVE